MRRPSWILTVLILVVLVSVFLFLRKESSEQAEIKSSVETNQPESVSRASELPPQLSRSTESSPIEEINQKTIQRIKKLGLTLENHEALLKNLKNNLDPDQEQLTFKQDNEEFSSLPGIVAVPTRDLPPNLRDLEIGEFIKFAIFREGDLPKGAQSYPLVLEKTRKNYQLTLLQTFPPIRLSIFSVEAPSVDKLIAISKAIKKFEGVESVSLDLLSNLPVPH